MAASLDGAHFATVLVGTSLAQSILAACARPGAVWL